MWVKIELSDRNEVYGQLDNEKVLDQLCGNETQTPTFLLITKTAKLAWDTSSATTDKMPEPAVVPLSPPKTAGKLYVATANIATISEIPESSNLVRSMLSHYSGLTITSTMPAKLS